MSLPMITELAINVGELKLKEFIQDRKPRLSDINWEDYNYPKHLDLIHFDLQDIPDESLRKTGKLMEQSFLGVVLIFAINGFVNIVGIALDREHYPPVKGLYTIFHSFIFLFLGIWTLYKGYKTLCGINEKTGYRILELVMLAFCGIAFVANVFCYHGVMGMVAMFVEGETILGLLILIEVIVVGLVFAARCYSIYSMMVDLPDLP
jgi:hypothetical protein